MQSSQPPLRRPFLITLLADGFMLCALAGGLRAFSAIQNWNLLQELNISPGPIYFLLSGIFWLATGLIGGLGLYTGWYHSERLARLATGLLVASFWGDRLLASRTGSLPPNTVFAAVISAAAVLFTLFALSRSSARRFLNRTRRPGWSYARRSRN